MNKLLAYVILVPVGLAFIPIVLIVSLVMAGSMAFRWALDQVDTPDRGNW
jgi:hypothetical protein